MKTTPLVKILMIYLLLCAVSVVVCTAAASRSNVAAQGHAPLLSATNQSSTQTGPRADQATVLTSAGELRLWGVSSSTSRANGALGQHRAPVAFDLQAKVITSQGTLPSDPLLAVRSPLSPTIRIYLPLIQHALWPIILEDDFEGPWPGPWTLDYNPGTNPYLWAKRDCRPYRGGYSAWVAGGNSGSSLSCGANYPDNLFTYMMYGPFSLEGAAGAELTFRLWLNSMLGQDQMYWGAALNGKDFWGFFLSGNSDGWEEFSLDLRYIPPLGDLTGESQVWIMLAFISDASGHLPEGAYVDDVLLRKTYSVQEEVIWQEFSFTTVGTSARGCAPADPDGLPCSLAPSAEFAGAPPWTLTAPPQGVTLRVTDGWYSGDVFDVYDFGTWIGRTSTANLQAECLEPNGCYRNPGMSSGEFSLAAGQHSITIVPSSSAYGAGAAFFHLD